MQFLLRDNDIMMSATNENAEITFTAYIHSNHSYSMSHALRYEGYSIVNEREL